MAKDHQDDSYPEQDTEQRLQRLLQGAFSGPPTPLKDIPRKNGESRRAAIRSRTQMKENPPKRNREKTSKRKG